MMIFVRKIYLIISDGIYIINLTGTLTLKEYYIARKYYCSLHHSACKECSSMLQVTEMIIQNGFVKLKTAFTTAFPTVKNYNQQYTRRRLLQMPLICLRIDYCPGISECILTEFIPGFDYKAFAGLLSSVIQQQERKFKQPVCYLDKSLLAGLLKKL